MTWRIVLDQKNEGATCPEFLKKSRISHTMKGGGVELHGQLMLSTNVCCLATNYERSDLFFTVTHVSFTVVRIFIELLQFYAQSQIGVSKKFESHAGLAWFICVREFLIDQ